MFEIELRFIQTIVSRQYMWLCLKQIKPVVVQLREHVFPFKHRVSPHDLESESASTTIFPDKRVVDPLHVFVMHAIEVGFPSTVMTI